VTITGNISKMRSINETPVQYFLPVGDEEVAMTPLIGKKIKLQHTGTINCINCDRKTKKSFSQGYCYPCSQRLAACDICIVRPEKCHFDEGTCREPEWGQSFCMQPHYVYLSNASGLKVGITRESQIPTRWIDQGAIQGLPILKAKSRFQVGLLEVEIKKHMSDKTNWQRMLKGQPETQDLKQIRDELFEEIQPEIESIDKRFGGDQISLVSDDETGVSYPVQQYPEKVKSFNFDKTPEVEGVLQGIKGQYLILDGGVINMRKFTGYEVTLTV